MIVKELRNFQHLTFEKGETIFNAGESGKFAYVINSGAIKLYQQIGEHQKILGFMKPGQVLGEMAIITGEPRTATAEAAEHTEILVVDDNVLHNILNRCLPLVKSLVEQFITRIRESDRNLHRSVDQCNRMRESLQQILQTTEIKFENKPDGTGQALLDSIRNTCQESLENSDPLTDRATSPDSMADFTTPAAARSA